MLVKESKTLTFPFSDYDNDHYGIVWEEAIGRGGGEFGCHPQISRHPTRQSKIYWGGEMQGSCELIMVTYSGTETSFQQEKADVT